MTPTQMLAEPGAVPKEWHAMIEELYDLRPIKNRKTYDRTMQVLRALMRIRRRNANQNDFLKTLSALIGEYEAKLCTTAPDDDPIKTLKFLMAENGMKPVDLGRILGDRSLATRILSRERPLNKAHILKLSEHFRVSPAIFM